MPPDAAHAAAQSFPWVQAIIQLVTAGGFGALVWYLIWKHLPKVEERHRAERSELFAAMNAKDAQHDTFAQKSIEVQERFIGRLDGMQKTIDQLPSLIKEHVR